MRVFGLILITFAPALFGWMRAYRESKRPEVLLAFARLIEQIRFEISTFSTRQSALYDHFENPVLEQNGFLAALRAAARDQNDVALYSALEAQKEKLDLDAESYRVLAEYARTLGRGYLSDELERAKKTETFLSKRADLLKEDAHKRARLYRSAGFLFGASAFLLFC